LPSRIVTGTTGSPDSIRALIRSDPSIIQQGLRLLDFDVRTGPATSLDAIGVDQSGSLALIVIASSDAEAALPRLLEAHLWAADQSYLLGRLYAGRGVASDGPAHGFLLAPSFTHAFLRRLSLLSVRVTPFLARDVAGGDGSRRAIVEAASPVFGLVTAEEPGPAEAGRGDRHAFWPDGVLPSNDPAAHAARPVPADPGNPPGAPSLIEFAEPADEMPWPDAPDERFPWDTAEPGPSPAPAPPEDEPVPGSTFETLTREELDEFERFERQRLERGRRSS
jgi:hypothetical protein